MWNPDWVDVEDDFPVLRKNSSRFSVVVRARTEGGMIRRAYYDYDSGRWVQENGNVMKPSASAWQSL